MLNLVTDRLPEYAVFNKNIVFRMEFFTTVRDTGFGWSSFLPRGSGVGRTTLPPCARSCGRCKNLRTGYFTKTAMQATQRHIFWRRLFFGRLKNTDLRTCANCKQLTAIHFQKHPVLRFLHRGGELYQQSWTKSKSNGKEQQFTSAPAGAVRFRHRWGDSC